MDCYSSFSKTVCSSEHGPKRDHEGIAANSPGFLGSTVRRRRLPALSPQDRIPNLCLRRAIRGYQYIRREPDIYVSEDFVFEGCSLLKSFILRPSRDSYYMQKGPAYRSYLLNCTKYHPLPSRCEMERTATDDLSETPVVRRSPVAWS